METNETGNPVITESGHNNLQVGESISNGVPPEMWQQLMQGVVQLQEQNKQLIQLLSGPVHGVGRRSGNRKKKVTNRKAGKHNKFNQSEAGRAEGSNHSGLMCASCGRKGHLQKNCFISQRRCFRCGSLEHKVSACPCPHSKKLSFPIPSVGEVSKMAEPDHSLGQN